MTIKIGWVVLGGIALAIICFFAGMSAGFVSMRKDCQAAAVKAGHAQYVVTDEYGGTKFEWLPNHGTEKPVEKKP